ncbi:MAG: hypothetical protein PHX21_11615 [bacterium]|nr:hypothetical protein [bacterium]
MNVIILLAVLSYQPVSFTIDKSPFLLTLNALNTNTPGDGSINTNLIPEDSLRKKSFFKYSYLQEFAAAYVFGSLGYYTAALIGYEKWDTNGVAIPGYAFYGLGASLGTWWVGNKCSKGGFWNTLAGCILLPSAIAVLNKYAIKSPKVGDLVVFYSVPVGAFLGFNKFFIR